MAYTRSQDGIFSARNIADLRVRNSLNFRFKPAPELKTSSQKKAESLILEGRVTSRDMRILETLYNAVPILTRHQIQRLFWPSNGNVDQRKVVSNRLRKLMNYNMVQATPHAQLDMRAAGLEPCYAYFLGPVGHALLARWRGVERRQLRKIRNYYHGLAPVMLLHDILVSEWFTVQATKHPNLIWVGEWKSRVLDEYGNELVRPDAMYRTQDSGRFTFLEIERHPDKSRLKDKAAKYERAFAQGKRPQGMNYFPGITYIASGVSAQRIAENIRPYIKNTRWRIRNFPLEDDTEWIYLGQK